MRLTNVIKNLYTFNKLYSFQFKIENELSSTLEGILIAVITTPELIKEPEWDYDSVTKQILLDTFKESNIGGERYNAILTKMIEENQPLHQEEVSLSTDYINALNAGELSFIYTAYEEDGELSVGIRYTSEIGTQLPGFISDGDLPNEFYNYITVEPGKSASYPAYGGLEISWLPTGYWDIKGENFEETISNEEWVNDDDSDFDDDSLGDYDFLDEIYVFLSSPQNLDADKFVYLIGNNPPINSLGTLEEFKQYVYDTLGSTLNSITGVSHIKCEIIGSTIDIYEIFDHTIEQNGGEIPEDLYEPITITYLGNDEWVDSNDMVGRLGLDDSLDALDQNLIDYFKTILSDNSVSPDMSDIQPGSDEDYNHVEPQVFDENDVSVSADFRFKTDIGQDVALNANGIRWNCIVELTDDPSKISVSFYNGNTFTGDCLVITGLSNDVFGIEDVEWTLEEYHNDIDPEDTLIFNQTLIDTIEAVSGMELE